DSGRSLVTSALGALAQDPLVGRLLERLDERAREAYTATGLRRRTADSPLVQRTREIDERKKRLETLRERVCQSEEIAQRVQALTEQSARAAQDCARVQRRVDLLHAARDAREGLDRVRAYERSVEEARRGQAEVEGEVVGHEA